LPFDLKIHPADSVEKQHFIHVSNFSKDTGDFKTLSSTDMKVIALGVKLAYDKGEQEKIKLEPKPLAEFRPKTFRADYEK